MDGRDGSSTNRAPAGKDANGGIGGGIDRGVDGAAGVESHGDGAEASGLSRQARKRLRTRQRILDAAVDLITRQGYEDTTVQAIADAADISLRTFYNYFESKADVSMGWFNDWAEALAASIDAQPEDRTPAELLAGAMASMSARGYANAAEWSDDAGRPMLPPQAAAFLGVSDPAFSGTVHQRLVFGFRRLAGLFRDRLGYAEEAWEPYVIAGSIVSLWFIAVHGSHDMVDRGLPAPSVHVSVQRAFDAYSQGLERLWSERPPPR